MLDNILDADILKTRDSYVSKLKNMGIRTILDLLEYFPKSYSDEQEFTLINEMRTDQINVIRVKIQSISANITRTGKSIVRAIVSDSSGQITVIWFNQSHLKKMYFSGSDAILTGKMNYENGKMSMLSPKIEKPAKDLLHTGRIVPVYASSSEITSKWLREKIHKLLGFSKYIVEFLPEWIIESENLMSFSDAICNIHFPKNEESLEKAKERLAFNELFLLQFMALRKKKWWQDEFQGLKKNLHESFDVNSFYSILPFELTNAQKRTINEILVDLKKDHPMLRLVQGDVGSGKTAVAGAGVFAMLSAGFQCAVMAPTEILAKQHYNSFVKLFKDFDFNIQLLTGSNSKKDKSSIYAQIATGTCDLVVGTHSLIQDDVQFLNLGLLVVDEQHRFGVKQRAKLKDQGSPHLLNLSATPIPRTMALTIYGDQDLSILDEMPPGRTPIITRIVPESKRKDSEYWVADQVAKGRQVFIICPLVEESDSIQVKAVTVEFERLQNEVFQDYRLALLHGKMKPSEKDQIMKDFSEGNIDILVSTSVVEVGIDVPNASIMIIEGADRFGLAQLHQFRGRVGRGSHQSYCFLFSDSESQTALKRLKLMVDLSSGFDLAEMDLQLRGAGEIYGLKQSGIPDLKMANFGDKRLLAMARTNAEKLMQKDINLEKHKSLSQKLEKIELQMLA